MPLFFNSVHFPSLPLYKGKGYSMETRSSPKLLQSANRKLVNWWNNIIFNKKY